MDRTPGGDRSRSVRCDATAAELGLVLERLGSLDATVAARLVGPALLGGRPLGPALEWPASERAALGDALAASREVLIARLAVIAPDALGPEPIHGYPVISTLPWLYLELIVEAKVLAIVGASFLGPAELERLERPWRAVFG